MLNQVVLDKTAAKEQIRRIRNLLDELHWTEEELQCHVDDIAASSDLDGWETLAAITADDAVEVIGYLEYVIRWRERDSFAGCD